MSVVPPTVQTSASEGKTSHLWFSEWNTSTWGVMLAVEDLLYQGQSEFQKVQILKTDQFGKGLVLDGMMQSCENDEFIYHESLVHPAMVMHENPKRVFVGGGGEGCTAREVLRHKSVEKLIMCDIDQTVVENCRDLLPEFHQGALDADNDDRVELVFDDAYKYLVEYDGEPFDVMIFDFCDPQEGGPAFTLYSLTYYEQVAKKLLAEGGIFITQSGPCDVINSTEVFTPIIKTVEKAFGNSYGYDASIPSFGSQWGFSISLPKGITPFTLSEDEIDARIKDRVNPLPLDEDQEDPLKFYDGQTHCKIFSQPKHIRTAIKEETREMTKDNPIFIFC